MQELISLLQQIANQKADSSELVSQFQSLYDEVEEADRPLLFDALLRNMEIRKAELEVTLAKTLEADDDDPISWTRQLTKLRRQLESPRLRAFRRFLAKPGGLPFLLNLRSTILVAQRKADLDLEPLDVEIAHLFDSWFQSGFLFLSEITLESSFREIRFLKEHDMVHPMASLEEMGTRVGKDRRLFALFHRAMPEEPVVFIEAALTRGIVRSIDEILGDPPEYPSKGAQDTAIFYSINNTQHGLVGLGLGKTLIFEVMKVIRRDEPGIKVFATLSPIPGLWDGYLARILDGDDASFQLKRSGLGRFFSVRAQRDLVWLHNRRSGREMPDFTTALYEILSDDRWIEDTAYVGQLTKPLTELVYFYINEEKNRSGKPLNPVAAFHLANGARASRDNVNFGANLSERGLSESCGFMVNYVYSTTKPYSVGRAVRSLLPWRS